MMSLLLACVGNTVLSAKISLLKLATLMAGGPLILGLQPFIDY